MVVVTISHNESRTRHVVKVVGNNTVRIRLKGKRGENRMAICLVNEVPKSFKPKTVRDMKVWYYSKVLHGKRDTKYTMYRYEVSDQELIELITSRCPAYYESERGYKRGLRWFLSRLLGIKEEELPNVDDVINLIKAGYDFKSIRTLRNLIK